MDTVLKYLIVNLLATDILDFATLEIRLDNLKRYLEKHPQYEWLIPTQWKLAKETSQTIEKFLSVIK